MNRLQSLRDDLRGEIAITRRHLERIPAEHFDWKPHAKSNSLGRQAAHLVECILWVPSIFGRGVHDGDSIGFPRIRATDPADLLRQFDQAAEEALSAMDNADPDSLDTVWSMTMGGRTITSRPREAAFRNMAVNHLIHHRGQLTVYLRLLDVPLASTYGPTADEGM